MNGLSATARKQCVIGCLVWRIGFDTKRVIRRIRDAPIKDWLW